MSEPMMPMGQGMPDQGAMGAPPMAQQGMDPMRRQMLMQMLMRQGQGGGGGSMGPIMQALGPAMALYMQGQNGGMKTGMQPGGQVSAPMPIG